MKTNNATNAAPIRSVVELRQVEPTLNPEQVAELDIPVDGCWVGSAMDVAVL
jgi:hypothetical protein